MPLQLIIFIQYLVSTLDGFDTGLMFEIANSKAEDQGRPEFRLSRVLPFWASALVMMLFKVIAGAPTPPVWLNMLQTLAVIMLLRVIYHLSWVRVMAWTMIWYGTAIVVEIPAYILYPEIITAGLNWTREDALFLLVFVQLMGFIVRVLTGFMIRRKDSFGWKDPQMLVYLGLAVGIVFLFPILEKTSAPNQMYFLNVYIPFTAVASLAVFGCVIAHWLHARFRMNIEKTKVLSEPALSSVQNSQSEEELAKIRHDAGNVMSTVSSLFESGRKEEAEAILRSLSEKMDSSVSDIHLCEESADSDL